MRHTSPTPFKVFRGEKRTEIMDQRGLPVAHVYATGTAYAARYTQPVEANAEFITRACNAHAELVDALQIVVEGWQLIGSGRVPDRKLTSFESEFLAKFQDVLARCGEPAVQS